MRNLIAAVFFLATGVLAGTSHARSIVSDQAAALLIYPYVASRIDPDIPIFQNIDTAIQISNTSNEPVQVKCYYVNALGKCSLSGGRCIIQDNCEDPNDTCLPEWAETDFGMVLTAQQPLAFAASEGLQSEDGDLPLDGVFRVGPNGQSNLGTRIPPLGVETPNIGFAGIGELKCFAVNADGTPRAANVLVGNSTIIRVDDVDVMKHNAIGFRAVNGNLNADEELVLGGDGAEYDGCPETLILNHFFDFATDPVTGGPIRTRLVLVPCAENFKTQVPTHVTAQYLVFNEFEQRLSTSKPVDCFFETAISTIDTTNQLKSIFSSNVAGTLVGQTRIRPVGGGLVGVALELHNGGDASINIDYQGERSTSDVITVVH